MDTTKLPFSLDYGMGFEQIYTPAADMTNSEFVKTITSIDFNYDYSDPTVDYSSKNFFETLASDTSSLVDDTTGYVWDTAKGAYVRVASSVSALGDVISDAGKELKTSFFDSIDSLLLRGAILVGILLAVLYVLAKTGILSEGLKIFLASKR